MADAQTNSQKVATGIMQIMAASRHRAATFPTREFGEALANRHEWVDEAFIARGVALPAKRPPAHWWPTGPEPDSPSTTALANALDRTIAAGTWNGTSFGRK